MNLSWAHVHLIFNHFPIVGAIFGLLLLVYAIRKKSEELQRASYWSFVIIALITILVFLTGTQAAELVHDHKLPNVSDSIVHRHKDIAEQALIALEILGLMSLGGLLLFRGAKITPNWFTVALLIVAVISTCLVSWAGVRGGMIRHTEVRGDLEFLAPTGETKLSVQKEGLKTEHAQSN